MLMAKSKQNVGRSSLLVCKKTKIDGLYTECMTVLEPKLLEVYGKKEFFLTDFGLDCSWHSMSW